MLKGFRDFILRGNVVDLAIAVVIGVAFTTLVSAFTKALITPLIAIFLGGGVRGGTWKVRGQTFDFTLLINAVITFVITAAVVYFLVVVPMQKILTRLQRGQEAPPEAAPEDLVVLREIRDALLSQGPRL